MPLPDVIVVGAGVMGCSIGLRLAQAGARVTLLERAIPGAEASSAAAGALTPQMEADGPGPFLELCLRSRGLYPKFAAELEELSGININYLPSGALVIAFSEDAAHRMEARVAWQKAFGLRADLLSGEEARRLEPQLSPAALAAAHFPDDHQVDNRLLVRALSIAAARSGVHFRTGYVRSVLVENDRAIGVDLDGDALRADAVVLAAGSWSALVPGARVNPGMVKPVRGQMVELRARLPLFRSILASDDGYLVPRVDGRIIAGSTLEFVGFEKQVTLSGLSHILDAARALCPALAELPVQEFWAGLRPYTEDKLPIIGKGPMEGIFLATGHFRNGILLTPITAQLISEVIRGQSLALDLRPFRHERFGGA